MLLARELTEQVIGLAIEVHRVIGPGMLESVYEGCLCHELEQAGIAFERQVGIPVTYKGIQFDEGFRADIGCTNTKTGQGIRRKYPARLFEETE